MTEDKQINETQSRQIEKKDVFAIVISIFALIFTAFSVVATVLTLSYTEEQTRLNSTVATFQVQEQATADYQYAQQLNIQQTQIAMQSKIDSWARQQALPYVKVIIPPEHVFMVEKITSEKTSSGYVITGEGLLEIVLSNDGGGRASLLSIDWVKDVGGKVDLFVRNPTFGDVPVTLPNTIEAQTPVKIKLDLEAKTPYSDDPSGKSDYQLGESWKKLLQSSSNHLIIRFSNADPINIEISDIQLAIPVADFKPNPPSPFIVTNQTFLTMRCFRTNGKGIVLRAVNHANAQNAEITVRDGDCLSFPMGIYEFSWREMGSSSFTDTQVISLTSDTTSAIVLTSPLFLVTPDIAKILFVSSITILIILSIIGIIKLLREKFFWNRLFAVAGPKIGDIPNFLKRRTPEARIFSLFRNIPNTRDEYDIYKKTAIGRDPTKADLVFNNDCISRLHCIIYKDVSGDWFIEDQDSVNGTFVNETRLAPHQKEAIENGAILQFGPLEMGGIKFRFEVIEKTKNHDVPIKPNN